MIGTPLACAAAAACALAVPTTPLHTDTVRSNAKGMTAAAPIAECAAPRPEWLWCDDFEEDRLRDYFEYDNRYGSLVRVEVGRDGSWGMRARWSRTGQVSAGSLKLAFGRTPAHYIRPIDDATADYEEIFWRVYVRTEPGWTGGGGHKLSRATSLVSGEWAQSMIAHVWSSGRPANHGSLVVDPASGTDPQGALLSTRYNDFENLRWLGARRGEKPLFAGDRVGRWHCVEAGVRLNEPGNENGWFRLWIDDRLDAERTGLNWRGTFAEYGINAVFLENYWNDGAPQPQERYFDNFVVSTERIGC
jgi:hypothetical protein